VTAPDVTRDGSPIDVYRVLPPMGEPELIHAAVAAGATILDLGCGTGRLATPLADLGHTVTGVDDSAEMLAELDRRIEPVLGDAREIRLDRTFDVVLLASHLVNDIDASRTLATAAAHLDAAGTVIAEVYPPEMDWAGAVGRQRKAGPVEITVLRADVDRERLDAVVRYRLGERAWDQPFSARMLDQRALEDLLDGAGLRFDRWLDRERGWFRAVGTVDRNGAESAP
jgi:SAM-dependent methyltransferase